MTARSDRDRGDALAARAEKVQSMAAENAVDADRIGRLHPEVVTALRDAGFARHFVPAEVGGHAGTFADLTSAVAIVAEGCAATAWCASLVAAAARFAAYLPARGRAEIWADGPDALIVAAQVPAGTAEPTEGGWRIGGRWSYVSGIEFADWVLLCGPADGTDTRFFAMPKRKLRIVRTWDAVGMRATGSHTVECADVYVPVHLTFPRGTLLAGRPLEPAGAAHCYTVPFRAAGGLTFVAPALGAARTAVEAAVPAARRRTSAGTALARSAGTIDAAGLLVERIADTLDDPAASDPELARNARDAALAGEMLRSAVADIVAGAGTSAMSAGHPVQRIWRDITTATGHAALRFETAAAEHVRLFLA